VEREGKLVERLCILFLCCMSCSTSSDGARKPRPSPRRPAPAICMQSVQRDNTVCLMIWLAGWMDGRKPRNTTDECETVGCIENK